MPNTSIMGKVFFTIPYGKPAFQMLDVKLAMYLPLLPSLPPGVFLVSADDFVLHDLGVCSKWSLPSTGFIALAHPSPVSVGRNHGVYVVDNVDGVDREEEVVVAKCLQVLQKPSDESMREAGALIATTEGGLRFAGGVHFEEDVVYTDSAFHFGVDVMKRLLQLTRDIGAFDCEIDAYRDFLQALGTCASDAYIHNTSNISFLAEGIIENRKKVYNSVHGCDISLLLMNASRYVHIGTMSELIHHFCTDTQFQMEMSVQKDTFNGWLNPANSIIGGQADLQHSAPRYAAGCVIHSVMGFSSCVSPSSVVEYCHLDRTVTIGENAIISHCEWIAGDRRGPLQPTPNACSPLILPDDLFVHTVPIVTDHLSGFVTVFFSTSDDLKFSLPVENMLELPFMMMNVGVALKQWNLKACLGYVEGKGRVDMSKVSLWDLRIYPCEWTMTSSLELSLHMIECLRESKALPEDIDVNSMQFFSLSDIMLCRDIRAMLTFRRKLFKLIQSCKG